MRIVHGVLLAALAAAACSKPADKTQSAAPAAQAAAAPQSPGEHPTIASSLAEGAKLAQGAAQGGMAVTVGNTSMPGTGTVPAQAMGEAAAPLSAAELAVVYKMLNLKPAPGAGQVMNDCGEAATPGVYAAELGGEVGRAYLIVMMGGPNSATCYGMTGMAINLLRKQGEAFNVIFSGAGSLAVMPGTHKGVHDIAIGGPGFEFPVYAWNGTDYQASGTIKDTEFPASLN